MWPGSSETARSVRRASALDQLQAEPSAGSPAVQDVLERFREDAAHLHRMKSLVLTHTANDGSTTFDDLRQELEYVELIAEAEAELALELR